MAGKTAVISGWGRYPLQTCTLLRPERYAGLHLDAPSLIARGLGRSYGDAALNEGGDVLLTERVNRMLEFDPVQGILRAEAGVTLAEILQIIVPQGWFLPVTPGTKFVSLGGCVAADVHGKNHHHDGSCGEHVLNIQLILADGTRMDCSAGENAEIFWATLGGMGLTGIIGEVTLKLQRIPGPHMRVRHVSASDLGQLFQLLQDTAMDDRYSVAWIDSMASGSNLGRGVLMSGHHATRDEMAGLREPSRKHARSRILPFDMPAWVLNPLSIGAFNAAYHRSAGSKQDFFSSHDAFFYPLDMIGQWNRLYGKRGFVQYQCVIPTANAFDGVQALLQVLVHSRRPSFLAVLKRFGAQGRGLLSFPMEGYTLALDMPVRDAGLFALLDELDAIVLGYGGRVYLAKDARLSAESFRAMYPRYEEWLKIKHAIDPQNKFSSSMARRLGIGGCAR